MCGISGIYHLKRNPVDPRIIRDMVAIQHHRGPDDNGMRLFSLAHGRSVEFGSDSMPAFNDSFEGGLGFNRLSILDLSEAGHQPMANDDGSVFLIFNGEIYNAFDYVTELQAAGYRFRSRSDTEVILRLYEHYGIEGMLERLNGMFAICIVDLRRRELHLIRDRLGIKPLYWAERNGLFMFASEVKSFGMHPDFPVELDEEMVDECLVFRYCAGEGALLKHAHQLRPGCRLRLTPDGITHHRYWQIPDGPTASDVSEQEAADQLEEHLHRAVRMQLLSDVKVGCQLSGGIDSSMISVLARRHHGADMDTFSIVFRDPRYSEEQWVNEAAAVANADSHRYYLNSGYFLDNIEKCTWHLDQPLNLPNSIGIYHLAEKARSLVTVLLSGEGADELLGGYIRFYFASIRSRVRPWLPLLKRLPRYGHTFVSAFGDPKFADIGDWFMTATAFVRLDKLRLLRPDARPEEMFNRRRAIWDEGRGDALANCLKYDMQTYMVDLLVRQDKMTMAHSMENRVPFLDHELVTFIRSLSPHHLVRPSLRLRQIKSRGTKMLLKKLARNYFDESFVYREKAGFAVPVEEYVAEPKFKAMMEEKLLPGMRRRGIVQADVVERWWRNLAHESYEMADALWSCISFEVWAQQFLDVKQPGPKSLDAGQPSPDSARSPVIAV
jgi:asparagine synthase (glutamine-hydrolysing)